MNKKVYMLIQLNEKKGDRVICVSEDMMVCIRRVKTLELGNVGKFDITHRPGLINISNVIKHVHYQIISRDILYTSDTIDELFVLSRFENFDGVKLERIYNVFESMEKAKSLIDIISNKSSCISKGIGKWTYIAGNKTDPPDAKPLMWVIRRYIIE